MAFDDYLPRNSISIHSLHTEGDLWACNMETQVQSFQSTPSTRRETLIVGSEIHEQQISIHSLHTEGDRHYSK